MIDYIQKLINDNSFNLGDGAAGGITLAAFFQAVPKVSAILSLVWVALRIYVTIRDDLLKKKDK